MDRYNERLVYGKTEGKTYTRLFLVSLLMLASFFLMFTISSLFLFIAVLLHLSSFVLACGGGSTFS